MNEGLLNRHNIVKLFKNNLHNLSVSNKSTSECMVYEIDNLLSIERYVKENKYVFSMFLTAFCTEEEYVQSFNMYSGTTIQHTFEVNDLANVMTYDNGKLSMVSTEENDKWISYHRMVIPSSKSSNQPWAGAVSYKDKLQTVLNMSFSKLPLTEETHFQQLTVDPLVLELEYCLYINDIIEYIKQIGCIVQVDPKLNVHLFFKGK